MTQSEPPPSSSHTPPPPSTRLRVEPEDIFLRDASNRAWLLRGVNLSGSCKFPRYPVPVPSHKRGVPFLQPRKMAHGQQVKGLTSSLPPAAAAVTKAVTPTALNADSNGVHHASDAEHGRNEGAHGDIRSMEEPGPEGEMSEATTTTDMGVVDSDKDNEMSISFVGRPFELHEADEHLARLRHWGFRMIRWVVTWEAVEHAGPGVYDQEFLDYTVKALLKAKEYGFKVMIDFHQDVWSRFSGGSGAPLWTFYVAGLDPHHFAATGAAAVHNTLQENEPLLRMVWLTNYYKLACATMFTLFYAGRILAPNCTFENGVNIQDYLQEHFLGAIRALVDRIHDCRDEEGRILLEDDVVIGYDSWNEPSNGWIGLERLDVLPEQHDMRQGDMPTPLQSLMLGEGMTVQNVATFQLELVGPVKTGSRTIQPSEHPDADLLPHDQKPIKAWLHPTVRSAIDRKYGFKRDECFPRAGECLWAQHGVWSIRDRKVLRQDYFARGPLTSDEEPLLIQWVPDHWLPFAKRVIELVRSVHPTAILFLEPPVYVPAPDLVSEIKAIKTPDEAPNQVLLDNMVYTPHHYDDLVLLTKKYLGWVNIDLLGLSRGRHKSLYGSIIFGKKATESLFGSQIGEIQKECYGRLGKRPVLIGETGLHFDVGLNKSQQAGNIHTTSASDNNNNSNEKHKKQSIWKTFRLTSSKPTTMTVTTPATATGRGLPVQSNQFVKAFDNILQGLDRTLAHYTLWNYTIENTKQFGDGWNGEDLSLYSAPAPLPPPPPPSASIVTTTKTSSTAEESVHPLDRGGRAVEQFCRPYPVATVGQPTRIMFDRHFGTFKLWTKTDSSQEQEQQQQHEEEEMGEGGRSEIYIPQLHFPDGPTKCRVEVSDGSWEWDTERQLLFWTYGSNTVQSGNVGGGGVGEHWLQVTRKL
ncbi:glycoside hydrolase superfamily [Linnemannia elongata]|nr:glycoside hydrolase superfamily [Linnemannia elongata]